MNAGAIAERSGFLVAQSQSMSGEARIALFALIGLLLMILGFLVAFALIFRKRSPRSAASVDGKPAEDALGDEDIIEEVVVATSSPAVVSGGQPAAGGQTEAVACPTCQREFEMTLEFCPHDARRLVRSSEIADARPRVGRVCPHCQRSFEAGMRFCPHDATELVPEAVYAATRGRTPPAKPSGVMGKICPRCSRRHDLSERFCTKDGAELVTIN